MDDRVKYCEVAGRLPSFEERRVWRRTMTGTRQWAFAAVAVLTAVFANDAVWLAQQQGDAVVLVLTWLFATAGTLFTVAAPFLAYRRQTQRMQTAWYDEQADKKCLTQGYTLTFYDTHVEKTDARGTTVLPYRRITECVETRAGWLLTKGTAAVLIRGADLTREQYDKIDSVLRGHIPPKRYRYIDAVWPLLVLPLPLPRFHDDRDAVLSYARVRVPYGGNGMGSAGQQTRVKLLRQLLLPSMAVFGAFFSQLVYVTPVRVLNLLIYVGGFMLVGGAVAALLTAGTARPNVVTFALTRDGVAAVADDHHHFTVWERMNIRSHQHGITIRFPDGGRVRLPWEAMDRPDAVQLWLSRRVAS